MDARYEVLRKVGESTVVEQLLAHRRDSTARVVLSVLQPRFARVPACFQAFRRQANLALQLRHPAIVRHLDVGLLKDGRPYVVTELLEGLELSSRVRQAGPFDIPTLAAIFGPLCQALEEARGRRIMHGNLGAGALKLDAAGNPKLLGFQYLLPDGRGFDEREDLRGLGGVLLELATGMSAPTRDPGSAALAAAPDDLARLVRACWSYDSSTAIRSPMELAGALLTVAERFELLPAGSLEPTSLDDVEAEPLGGSSQVSGTGRQPALSRTS